MKITKTQFRFIVNCDVEELVRLVSEDYGLTLIEAFDKVYNSRLYAKLVNERTGLYIESPLCLYDYLKEELGETGIVPSKQFRHFSRFSSGNEAPERPHDA